MNKIAMSIFLVVLTFFSTSEVYAAQKSLKNELVVKENLKITDSKMYLSDFIETDNIELYQKAKGILIGYFLYPIKERRIKGEYIKLKLKQAGLKEFDNIIFPEEILAFRDYPEEEKKKEEKTVKKSEISLKKSIKLNSDKIFLSEIIDKADKDIIEKTSEILIGYMPNPGEEKILSGNTIKLKIKQSKIQELEDIKEIGDVVLIRESQIIDKEMLGSMITGILRNKYFDDIYSLKVDTYENEKYVIPPGEVTLDIKDDRLESLKIGRMTVAVSIFCNNILYKKINANVEIGKTEKILVLNKDVNKGDVLSDRMYVEKERIIYNEKKNSNIKSAEPYKNKVFKKNKKSGEILEDEDFEKRKIFKKGEIVKVEILIEGATLITNAKALQDGFEGEAVNISNEKTKKILTGIVENDGTVKINIE